MAQDKVQGGPTPDEIASRLKTTTVWAMPASWYWDPEVYAEERHRIFFRHWLCIGREQMVAQPGQYLTASPAGFPIFVLRGEDGTLNGFHNVCRHRAAKLLTARTGSSNGLTCPYHGWRYDAEGGLKHAPFFGEARDFPKHELSLFAIRVDAWRGLIFVNLDLAGSELEDWLGPLASAVAETAPAEVEFHRDVEFEIACNWKNYVDNYQEGYHIPLLHSGLHRDLQWKRYRVINFDGGSLHEGPARGTSSHPGSFGWRFPNFTFVSYPQGLSFLRMEPLGPRRMRLVYSFFRPAGVSEQDFEATFDYGMEVSKEDQWITPLVQENLEAGVYEKGPLSPRHENGVYYFHELVRDALAST